MLITITNSNSSPEANSSEVSSKSQCEFRVCTRKTSFGRRSLRDLCVCAHMCLYEFVPPLENLHSKDELQSSFKLQIFLSCVRSDQFKDELQSSLQ